MGSITGTLAGPSGSAPRSWSRPQRPSTVLLAIMVSAVLGITIPVSGCRGRPQDLPVVVSADEDAKLQWLDPHGPLKGEVPWVLRTDLLGPDTFLVVETADGDRCARTVSFPVLAAGVTEYEVYLVSDLHGRVSWQVTSGGGHHMKLFTCSPRPAENRRRECLRGGIPKPLFGELVGSFSAELVGGTFDDSARALRFENGFLCVGESVEFPSEQE